MMKFVWMTCLVAGFGLASCKKEAPTTARIIVKDADGNKVPNAEVRLFPGYDDITGSVVLDHTLHTDLDGDCIFNYTDYFNLGQAGFALLDIEVNKDDELFGDGIIKIEEEKHNEETVIVHMH